jgi:hypothetical protein
MQQTLLAFGKLFIFLKRNFQHQTPCGQLSRSKSKNLLPTKKAKQ